MVSDVGKVCLDFNYHHCGHTFLLEFVERCPMLGLIVVSVKIENTIIIIIKSEEFLIHEFQTSLLNYKDYI